MAELGFSAFGDLVHSTPTPFDCVSHSLFQVGSGSPRRWHKPDGAGSVSAFSVKSSINHSKERKCHPEITHDFVPWKPDLIAREGVYAGRFAGASRAGLNGSRWPCRPVAPTAAAARRPCADTYPKSPVAETEEGEPSPSTECWATNAREIRSRWVLNYHPSGHSRQIIGAGVAKQ